MDECLLKDGIHRKSARPGTTSLNSAEIFVITFIAFMFVCMFEPRETLFEIIRLGLGFSLFILTSYFAFSFVFSMTKTSTAGDFILPYFGAYVSCFRGSLIQTFVLSDSSYCWHLDVLDSSIS